jgi:hypothetical protein
VKRKWGLLRVRDGIYTYRGHEIERNHDAKLKHQQWMVSKIGSLNAYFAGTLQAAKESVDEDLDLAL